MERLRLSISLATESTEVEILTKAMGLLDVDWPNLTEEGRGRIVDAVAHAMQPIADRVIGPVESILTARGPDVVRGTRRATSRQVARLGARVGISLTLEDQRIIDHLVRTQAHYVRDEYGRRREGFSRVAREVVADGLGKGLGRDEITNDLVERFGPMAGINRSRAYWNVIAGTYANRSRTWAQLASFEEAGIERYVFEAVLDERTTDQCAFLHGRVFEVGRAQQLYRDVEDSGDPESVVDTQPWIRAGRDESGNRILFTESRSGARTLVAEVVQSRVGQRDALGEFRNGRSTAELAEMGACTPPLHANCRSTINPEF